MRQANYDYKLSPLDQYDEIFATKESFNTVDAMGIDVNYNIDFTSLRSGLRAMKEQEVLILYAHKIDTSGLDYTVDPSYLKELLEMVQIEGVQSLRMRDLGAFFKRGFKQPLTSS